MNNSFDKFSTDEKNLDIYVTKKFDIYYKLNETKKYFSKLYYKDKSLSKEEKKIVERSMYFLSEYNILESFEHLMIKVENSLRDFASTKYKKGLIFAENIDENYRELKIVFRNFCLLFVSENIKKINNFQHIDSSSDWLQLKHDLKIEKLKNKIQEFSKKFFFSTEAVKFKNLQKNNEVYIIMNNEININIKPKTCLDIEIFLKNQLDLGLVVYLDYAIDQNKGRRLKS